MINSKTILTGEEWDLVFLLSPMAFKLWMFHYRCERGDRESWPGEETICQMCGIGDRKTLYQHRTWLKAHGWLVQTSGAYRGHNPTFRVERGWIPDRGCQMHERAEDGCLVCKANADRRASCVLVNSTQSNAFRRTRTGKRDADVYGSSSVSGSNSSSDWGYGVGVAVAVSNAPSPQGGNGIENHENLKTKTDPSSVVQMKKLKFAKDGTPWPEDFDTGMTNVERCAWLEAHDSDGIDYEGTARAQYSVPDACDPDSIDYEPEHYVVPRAEEVGSSEASKGNTQKPCTEPPVPQPPNATKKCMACFAGMYCTVHHGESKVQSLMDFLDGE